MTYKLPLNEDDEARFAVDLECYEDVADGLDGRQYLIRTIQNREQVLHDFAAHYMALGAKRERVACAKFVEDKFDLCGDELMITDAIRSRGEVGE